MWSSTSEKFGEIKNIKIDEMHNRKYRERGIYGKTRI